MDLDRNDEYDLRLWAKSHSDLGTPLEKVSAAVAMDTRARLAALGDQPMGMAPVSSLPSLLNHSSSGSLSVYRQWFLRMCIYWFVGKLYLSSTIGASMALTLSREVLLEHNGRNHRPVDAFVDDDCDVCYY